MQKEVSAACNSYTQVIFLCETIVLKHVEETLYVYFQFCHVDC